LSAIPENKFVIIFIILAELSAVGCVPYKFAFLRLSTIYRESRFRAAGLEPLFWQSRMHEARWSRRMTRKKQTRAKPMRRTETALLDTMRLDVGKGFKALNKEQRRDLLAMMALKIDPARALEPARLIPKGSIMNIIARGFDNTDINPLIGVFYIVTLAASHLTQRGAYLEIANVPAIRPTLWTICQAESGSSKTLATDLVNRALRPDGGFPVRKLPPMGTAAQWVIDLAESNGALWFQDEVGKAFRTIRDNAHHQRIKDWLLDAYSHKEISNRLKGESNKLVIEDPHLTFFGLTVPESWRYDIDLVSMLDGFCQRFNYALIPTRTDRDLFDVFLYESRFRADVAELWEALCGQKGAEGPYVLAPDVLPLLEDWWRGLRGDWGDFRVPASFIRRIGFSTLRYLMVLHFMLGKSGRPIDRETAILATRFAEFHLHSASMMIQSYDAGTADVARLVQSKASNLVARGKDPTPRNVFNSMSKAQRLGLDVEAIGNMLDAMQGVEVDGQLLGEFGGARMQKSNAIVGALGKLECRLRQSERKRNERRLRCILSAHRLQAGGPVACARCRTCRDQGRRPPRRPR